MDDERLKQGGNRYFKELQSDFDLLMKLLPNNRQGSDINE